MKPKPTPSIIQKLNTAEKLDRLHALIPADVCKIDNLNQATRKQLRQLKDGLAITETMQELRRQECCPEHLAPARPSSDKNPGFSGSRTLNKTRLAPS
jgi:hypothetical protein